MFLLFAILGYSHMFYSFIRSRLVKEEKTKEEIEYIKKIKATLKKLDNKQ